MPMMHRRVLWWFAVAAGLLVFAAGGALGLRRDDASASTPAVQITPAASPTGSYSDGQVVEVSVGSNSLFRPGLKVNILECADPGGTTANLPKSISNCDGNTIQGDTVLIQSDGSIAEHHYSIYELPSATLGEAPSWSPVCNQSNECVLYVGQDQNDFTQPKLFSAPFYVSPSSTPDPAAGSNAGSSPASSSGSTPQVTLSSSPAETAPAAGTDPDSQAALAYTGAPADVFWLMALGSLLILTGAVGRRLMKVAT